MKSAFQEKIGYRFVDDKLLDMALTHSSYAHECGMPKNSNNERLEFLGDAVLDTVISEYLFLKFPEEEEGKLTRQRALIVCEEALAELARQLQEGELLRLSHGEGSNGGRDRTSILADALEAVIGAVFLDGGWEAAREMVLRLFMPRIELAVKGKLYTDFKTAIQEKVQQKGVADIQYRLDREEGPDHDKTFYMSLWINGEKLSSSSGKNKKEAEQHAAKEALLNMPE